MGILALSAIGVAGGELPVRQVILYKHGVGYFERSGDLAPTRIRHSLAVSYPPVL